MNRYVQHISGQGEKWEVAPLGDNEDWFSVWDRKRTYHRHLPKSEYRLCAPPEVWVDVTDSFTVEPSGLVATRIEGKSAIELFGHNFSKYRLRKMQGYFLKPDDCFEFNPKTQLLTLRESDLKHWAFIIERKESA